jgi:hypothetical protein
MNERLLELQSVLSSVRRRWTQRALLRAWTHGALAAAAVLLAGLGAVLMVAGEGAPLVFTIAVVSAGALFALARALWPLRIKPTDRQLARFIEERSDLDDVLVTAVEYGTRPDSSPEMRECLAEDAVRAARGVELDAIVSQRSMRDWALRGVAAAAALAVVAALLAPSFGRATSLAAAYLFPTRLAVEVTPGSAKVRAGEPVTITARVAGVDGGLTPTLTVIIGDAFRDVRMDPAGESGTFQLTIENVTNAFGYRVVAASARSEDYTISVIYPPRVERIDVRYEFPKGLGLEPRTDEDSGDIYGPAGTKVRLTIVTDKPIARAALKLDDGTTVDLHAREQMLEGQLTIEDDGSYRIALADLDGLENAGDTEYFIRTLDDRPPDVRILRPAGDKKVTPLEEVEIEARADDDYGIASFDLVFQAPGGKEKVVPFRGPKGGVTAEGVHTMFMEDLGVQPGDFVTYFARARDVSRGRRSVEARSDIFFLEVKPFEEEFVAARSQAMGGGGGGDRNLQQLAEAQKEIIVATWKLDARARRARDAKPAQDIREVSKAQSDLKKRAEEVGGQASRTSGDLRRRRGSGGPAPSGNDPIGKAIESMGRAVGELEKLDTSAALPHEMDALNQLLKAEAENKRRQVARQQQAGGGGGMNRSEADLSALFDQELRKRNQTNYETPTSTEERQENKQADDPLEKIRELARRQDALARQQRELARNREQIEEEELKRQLERLTREQNQLRQEADQLSRQMTQRGGQSQQRPQSSGQRASGQQSSGQSSGQGQSSQGQQGTQQLREIAEEMRNAASDLQRQNPDQASARSERATDRLRELERQLQSARPDDRRRALGDLQLESKQLADAQRRLANEAGKTSEGQTGQDARRRLAGDQERLADRAERLQESVKQLARGGQGDTDERKATDAAARELERQRLAERMRQSAESLRNNGQAKQGDDIARALDQVAQRLGEASGAQDADSRRLSDQLAKTQELREKIASIERDIQRLQRAGDEQGSEQGQPGQGQQAQGQQGQQGQPGQQGQQGQQGQPGQGQQSQQAGQGSPSQGGGGQGSANARGGGEQGGNSLQQLQRDLNERMRDANRLSEEIGRENPGMAGAKTPEDWWRSFSAPGTEAFKQDFARWESLKKNLLVALEAVESQVSDQLRAKENNERLNAGGHDTVAESYRQLVEKYYRSLAAPRKPH